jgi:hypothetical protein
MKNHRTMNNQRTNESELWNAADARFDALHDTGFYRTLTPSEFLRADLDSLARRGVFPERDMLAFFRSFAEESLLGPVFGGDREALGIYLRSRLGKSADTMERIMTGYGMDALGPENVDFLAYCVSVALERKGSGNPYA